MARVRINGETMMVRVPEGTLAKVDSFLDEKENRADFIRLAVTHEIERRINPKGISAKLMTELSQQVFEFIKREAEAKLTDSIKSTTLNTRA